MTFAIEVLKELGNISSDSIHLIESCVQHNSYNPFEQHKIRYGILNRTCTYDSIKDAIEDVKPNLETIDLDGIIPIGSIEYVEQFLSRCGFRGIKPINIPKELNKEAYTCREIKETNKAVLNLKYNKEQTFFIKSSDRISKKPARIYKIGDITKGGRCESEFHDDENLMLSSIIPIEAEWRVFVYNGAILNIQKYNGDWRIHPDNEAIMNMVGAYIDCPPAYVMDVGIISGGIYSGSTVLIGVHNFIGVNLYGFYNKLLHNMYISAWKYEVNKLKGALI